MRRALLLLFLIGVAGCSTLAERALDQRFGAPDPARFDTRPAAAGGMSYRTEVRPLIERRCVVCHACYDAPCQLKLGTWDGIARGASKELVYDGARLLEAPTTRLYVDAQLPSQWREKGFFPVLNERDPTPQANLTASVLYRALDLKRRHPLPEVAVLPTSFDFSLNRDQQCPRIEQYPDFEQRYPLWGMPYGLPGLSGAERDRIARWLEQGAPYEGPPPLDAEVARQIGQWEAFLNGDSTKERLVSRYLFEHLIMAHLYFESDAQRHYFRLVRSFTPPGQPIRPVATRRPYDDPGAERIYYRLEIEREPIVAKTHQPYALGPQRMARWRTLFLDPDYKVDALPSYAPEVASNPFIAFRALPVAARYRFMLDEAQFTVMSFIKGPVCRGQIAVDVIEDNFWVFFVDPEVEARESDAEFLARETGNLHLPAEFRSNSPVLLPWIEYSRMETRYLEAKSRYLQQHFGGARKPTLDLIWNGGGENSNAALTVFRHFDSASVVKGLVGDPPKTAWVLGYPLLERIHYLLVAGFDVYGNVGHQLETRLYMDFLRMEGEFNFIALLPRATRDSVRDFWYRGASQDVKNFVYGSKSHFDVETGIAYRTKDPQRELYALLRGRLAPVLNHEYDVSGIPDENLRRDLKELAGVHGRALSWLPEASFLRVESASGPPRYFTLLRNTGHSNVSHVFLESHELLPDENTLTVVAGFIGAYPNAFYRVRRTEIPALTAAVRGLSSEKDYRELADRYAVRRTDGKFWAFSDALQDEYARLEPVDSGLFDYNRLENR